jgi:hypothetical protein
MTAEVDDIYPTRRSDLEAMAGYGVSPADIHVKPHVNVAPALPPDCARLIVLFVRIYRSARPVPGANRPQVISNQWSVEHPLGFWVALTYQHGDDGDRFKMKSACGHLVRTAVDNIVSHAASHDVHPHVGHLKLTYVCPTGPNGANRIWFPASFWEPQPIYRGLQSHETGCREGEGQEPAGQGQRGSVSGRKDGRLP